MRKWRPAPAAAAEAFAAATAGLAGVEPRSMFGYACIFAGGRMVAGLHEAGLMLRLPDAARDRFLRLDGATRFEPMPGRVMREYVVAPPALLARPEKLRGWLERARAYVATLPAKAATPKPRPQRPPAARSGARERPRRPR